MKKLFEIPIYALSPSKLNIRAKKRIMELEKDFGRLNPDDRKAAIDLFTFPKRNWDYNHIIGYIRIAVSKSDILFEVFIPAPIPEKYYWYSSRKIYVQNTFANGTHIYHGNLKTNEEFREAVSNMLDQVITDHIPPRFYVDKGAFDATNQHLNYLSIISEI